ncbi:MAG: hypothetical protein HZY79_05665 [Rhodoblastus sp.]|nr:MAG: hypothetical protein HZY79_05665 [Rhodoblastus sp.]
MTTLASAFRSFRRADDGAVAMIFGLSMIPMMVAAGAAVDYARAAREKAVIGAAVDATSLALAQDARRLDLASLKLKGQSYFDAVHHAQGGVGSPTIDLRVDAAAQRLTVSAAAAVPTTLMKLAGVTQLSVGSAATVAYGTPKIEVALVLDNTGSMSRSGKMAALQAAATDFVNQLAAKSTTAGEIKVGVIPFATQVRLDPARAGLIPAGATSVDPARAPWLSFAGVTPSNWTGSACVSDRPYVGDFDVDARADALYPAKPCQFGKLSTMIGLTDVNDPASAKLRDAIGAMRPEGNTNLTIGLSWGQWALTPGNPLAAAAPASNPDVQKFLVLLTDGDNTANGFGMAPAQIDDRTRLACAAAKAPAARTTVYTIRVIDGNVGLLRECASSPDKYYEAADASQIQPAFQKILDSILRIRLAS